LGKEISGNNKKISRIRKEKIAGNKTGGIFSSSFDIPTSEGIRNFPSSLSGC